MIELESKKRMESLKQSIEKVTGESYEDLTGAVKDAIDKAKLGEKIPVDSAHQLCAKNRFINYIERFDFSKTQDFTEMFFEADLLTSAPFIDISNASDITNMFYSCSNLIEVNNLNTSNIAMAGSLFALCSKLVTVDNLDTSKFTTFAWFFYGCTSLENVCLLDTSNVTSFSNAFSSCYKLKNISFVEECINHSINFANSPLLSNESKQSIFDGLAFVTTAQTLTLPPNLKILQSQVDSANAKGWTVAGGTVVSEEEYYG